MSSIQIIPFLVFSFVQTNVVKEAFPYDLKYPSHTIELDESLQEISGLALSEDGEYFYAIQDEAGKVYTIEESSGDIESVIDFWKDGDYEDLELVNGELFVLKSSGTLYQIQNLGQPEQQVQKYNTVLEKAHNTEGLCFDKARNCLLIACKNAEEDKPLEKSIYAFDLTTKKVHEHAFMHLRTDAALRFLASSPVLEKKEKMMAFFERKELRFSPSAIALHPKTGEVYMLSAVGNYLLVMDRLGQVRHIQKLSKKVHFHPEGLAFSPSGVLYISNEGGEDQPATIHRFDMETK